jgi:hypothetical protein
MRTTRSTVNASQTAKNTSAKSGLLNDAAKTKSKPLPEKKVLLHVSSYQYAFKQNLKATINQIVGRFP